jgi:hypothetical protein
MEDSRWDGGDGFWLCNEPVGVLNAAMKSLCLLFCLALLEARANPLSARNQTARSIYPLGIYAVNSTNDFALFRAAGFNLITGPADKSFLDAAEAAGLKVLASPGTSAGPGFDLEAATKTVTACDGHSALWAWYLVDEPDLQEIAPRRWSETTPLSKALSRPNPPRWSCIRATKRCTTRTSPIS